MTAFDHNFKSQGQLLNYCPKGVNHSQNNSTVIFSKFWDIPTVFFVIILKIDHKVLKVKYHQKMQTEMQRALILIRLFLFRPALLAQKNCKVAAGCGSYHKLTVL